MRILVTGAAGNLGRGVTESLRTAGHDLVLSDLYPMPAGEDSTSFLPVDVQIGVGLASAARDCDLILHLHAWHGIHATIRTEADFWRLNVDGTFWMFQAAVTAGVKRVVFLSSQAWSDHYDTYGFTKRVGEELCEYYRRNHGIRYVAVRPADFTPATSFLAYGVRLLYGGVDRSDVVAATMAAVNRLAADPPTEPEGIVVNAVRPNAFSADQIEGWEEDPLEACLRIFGGAARELVENYGLEITRRPSVVEPGDGSSGLGYSPRHHFGTFLDQLWLLDESLGPAQVKNLPAPR